MQLARAAISAATKVISALLILVPPVLPGIVPRPTVPDDVSMLRIETERAGNAGDSRGDVKPLLDARRNQHRDAVVLAGRLCSRRDRLSDPRDECVGLDSRTVILPYFGDAAPEALADCLKRSAGRSVSADTVGGMRGKA